jgi:ComF family protein
MLCRIFCDEPEANSSENAPAMAIGDMNPTAAQSGYDGQDDDAAPSPITWRQRRVHQWRRIANIWGAGLDVVFPPLCLGCQTRLADHNALCPECWRQIDFIRPPLCDRLGLPLPYDIGGTMISAAAAAHPPPFARARAVARYDGLMRKLIHDFKFNDTHDARHLFGRWLCQAAPELISSADCLVPVPLARFRLLTRRYNQAQLLAAELSRQTGKPCLPLALLRTRSTARQVGLTRRERERNVSGAFAVSPEWVDKITGKSVLLIDDVMTTGATVSAATKALKKAGAARVDVLALALVTDTVA